MAETMRAVVWEGKPYSMSVKDVARPKLLTPRDAIVRIEAAAICGTDLHTYHGIFGSREPPWVMGHEAIGIVDEVGHAVNGLKKGDRVAVLAGLACGYCRQCTRGNYVYCLTLNPPLDTDFYGLGQDLGKELGGLQAEYARVPFADYNCVVLPSGEYDPTSFVFVSDIFATGWSGLDFAGFIAGDSVAIFGAGPMGLLCAYSALLRGASIVYSIDHVQERLDKATSIGAIPINFTKEGERLDVACNGFLPGSETDLDIDPVKRILKELPDGVRRSVDCIGFEAVNPKLEPDENIVLQWAIAVTGNVGGIGIMGVYAGGAATKGAPESKASTASVTIPFGDFWQKNLSLKAGAATIRSLYPVLEDLIVSGRAKPTFIITSEISIEDAPQAYQRFSDHEEIKVIIRFNVPDATTQATTSVGTMEKQTNNSAVDGQEAQALDRLRSKMQRIWALEAEMDKLLNDDQDQGPIQQNTQSHSRGPSLGRTSSPRQSPLKSTVRPALVQPSTKGKGISGVEHNLSDDARSLTRTGEFQDKSSAYSGPSSASAQLSVQPQTVVGSRSVADEEQMRTHRRIMRAQFYDS